MKTNSFTVVGINLFSCGENGEFSADVRLSQSEGEEFSIQLGTDGEWSFAPEVEHAGTLEKMIDENDKKGRPTDWVAKKIASMVDAADMVEKAKSYPANWC